MVTVEEITERIRAGVKDGTGLGKTLKFDLRGEGMIHIDGSNVTNEDAPADLTISVSRQTLEALGQGKLNPMTAVMTGKLKLSDMALAMSLQPQMQALFSKLS